MTAEEYVKSIYPRAEVSGPVNTYWPGEGTKQGQYLILKSLSSSLSEGAGSTPEEAWEDAANRIHVKLFLKAGITSDEDLAWAKKELLRLPTAETEPGKEKAIEQLTKAIADRRQNVRNKD